MFVFHRLKIPSIVGFLLTGILAGPHGFELVNEIHEVEILAEIGVVLLLFTIGMEFSFDKLLQIKKPVLAGGTLQVVFTTVLVFVLMKLFGRTTGEAVFIGFLVSLSSTAIVLKLIQEKAEVDSLHGRSVLGILIFQDITIVPMILITPFLAGQGGETGASLASIAVKAVGIIFLVVIGAKWVVPCVFYQIARTRNRELFLLSVVVLGLAIAWLTSSAGLSLALGAFLAGLIISESEYSHHALGNILPFRDIFTSFFFVSIGMLFDIGFLLQKPVFVLTLAAAVIILKAVAAGITSIILGYPIRTTVLVGLFLSQVGEFSFILSKTGLGYGLLAGDSYQLFLAVSIVTMAATPFVMSGAHTAADFLVKLPLPQKIKRGRDPLQDENREVSLTNHLVIIGFGVNGRNLARAASTANIPYLVVETNPETVREEKENEPIYFGDATQEAVLKHVNIKEARVVVVAISDPAATRRIIEEVRRLNPRVYIIVRTRYLQEMEELHKLGANEVIPEEFETSVEIFTRVLNKYMVPRSDIEKLITEIRADNYEILRSFSKKPASISDLKFYLPDIELCTFRVDKDSPVVGKTLAQIDLRRKYGVTLLAINRDSEMLQNPHGDTRLFPGDIIVVVGTKYRLSELLNLFSCVNEIK